MSKYSLLVVDDEERARRHILEDIAWETLEVGPLFEADDGLSALKLLQERRPDIMIMDIRMPEMDGVELLEQMMQRGLRSQVITLSGYSDFEAARRMLSSGIVVEYLLKPASEDQLFEAVYKCIERLDGQGERSEKKISEKSSNVKMSQKTGEEVSGTKAAMIQTVKEYIGEHYGEHLTLSMAAELVYVNATYLSKLFAEVEGIGFSDYLCQVRMEQAKKLLRDYRKRIYEIAGEVGYQDVKHFMKVFKKQVGMTPSEYRDTCLLGF